jgi:clan AA aspartic protease
MLLPAHKHRARRQASSTLETVSYGEKKMGHTYADIELISGDDLALHRRGFLPEEGIKRMRVSALVDSGAYMLVVNEHIKLQLDLPVLGETTALLADESEVRAEIVGPVEIRFENRATTVRALMLPGSAEPLLGVIPMEDMDVVIDPKQQRLMVNPENPYIPLTYVK